MNERIRELYQQCRGDKYWNGTHYDEYPANIEKFTELIVQECVRIVAKRKDQAIDDGWLVDEAMSMAEMDLKEHFGVEE
jgi:hypothetical protein